MSKLFSWLKTEPKRCGGLVAEGPGGVFVFGTREEDARVSVNLVEEPCDGTAIPQQEEIRSHFTRPWPPSQPDQFSARLPRGRPPTFRKLHRVYDVTNRRYSNHEVLRASKDPHHHPAQRGPGPLGGARISTILGAIGFREGTGQTIPEQRRF